MFLDEATISVSGGQGGRGCVSWRREKYVPKGGPNGGNGGDGGNVILMADENTDTLSYFASTKHFEAEKGEMGMGKSKNGKGGEDLVLKVPPGTVVSIIENGEMIRIVDLSTDKQLALIAKGGRGGYGNEHFKSSIRQKPDFAELGEPGEEKILTLELKLVADIGIIGYPSVGKSTLISVISAAKPKIAAYPFTTITPNLGVVNVDDRSYIVCDVPGLIEGASEGKGLGDQFLKHIERCGILVHMLDVSRALEGTEVNAKKLEDDYKAIRKELEAYSPALSVKKEVVILNKTDLIGGNAKKVEEDLKKLGIQIFLSISAAARMETERLTKRLLPMVLKERGNRSIEAKKESDDLPVIQPHLESDKMGAYVIEKQSDDTIIVTGKRLEQFTKMIDFSSEGAVRRFRDVVKRIGLKKALEKEGFDEGVIVIIGDINVESYL
ncbi:GTPase ObgE [Patescibacteria group bacterium]|nr:GTPase ObgE [Patescibacteria group bacterium]